MSRNFSEIPQLNDTAAPRSAPTKRKLTREQELDLYDDIDGGLAKSEPKKKRGWKGWIEIDEDEESSDEEEVIITTTPRQKTKSKAKEALSSLTWTKSGKTKGTPKSIAVAEDEDEDELEKVGSRRTIRSTTKTQVPRYIASSEDSMEHLPEAESPVKPPSRRKRDPIRTSTAQEDIEMRGTGETTRSRSNKRSVVEEDIILETPSKSRRRLRKVVDEDEEEQADNGLVARSASKIQKPRRQLRQLNDTHDGPEAMDVDSVESQADIPASRKTAMANGVPVDKTPASAEITLIKSIVLSKLTQRRPVPLTNLDTEYAKVHQLLEATVTCGESNSMLLIGARGSGKTALINQALLDLSRSQKEHFHIVRLNGFIQTDDKLALREIWRQLGREMEIEDEEGTTSKSYADTLAMLLALLSHPDEISGERGGHTAKSVLFIMDEFDLFATHPRQTLLYNLLDIAQSRKAPIAVLGLTTRIDVTEALEKRVKSRFSHRYVHLNLARNLGEFADAAKSALKILPAELGFEERTILVNSDVQGTKKNGQKGDLLEAWNRAIDVSLLYFHV